MNAKWIPLSAAIALALGSAAASAATTDFHGYLRGGVGSSTNEGGTKSGSEFNKTKLGRLGNEFDTYGEVELGQEVFNKDGKSFYVDSMLAMDSAGTGNNENTKDNTANFGLKQLNVQAKGLIAAAPEAVLWAGKRFYQRHDLHIIDTKYWNVSGYGAGVEKIKAGQGDLSTAWIRDDANGLNINYADVRYAGLSPWAGSWIELGVDYAMPNKSDAQDNPDYVNPSGDFVNYQHGTDKGVMLTAELSQQMFGFWPKTVFQYATKGLAQNMVSQGGGWYDAWSDNEEAKGFRIINTAEAPITDNLQLAYVLTYGKTTNIDGFGQDQSLVSAVVRPIYQWDDYNKTMLELGYFRLNKDASWNPADEGGKKATISQAWSAGRGLLARPEIRVYTTYIKNDKGETFNNSTSDHDVRFGVQAEAWW
ncbi:maltoporin LamB [uncultured Tolumonas sp.]|uniref:maltoporin LamB n=1 Tax=uncultured Tolumonas sp. TaxID=263765 RepID=UPI00293139FF|nr:maltoporin LamB [uncultured Tolumonas sp.]